MAQFWELGLTDVRCFRQSQKIDLKPITFLVGENSTGKTSILGSLQAVADFLGGWAPTAFPQQPNFNIAPYQMGTFRDIVRRSNPKKESFTIDADFSEDTQRLQCSITFAEQENGSEAMIQSVVWKLPDVSIGVYRQKQKVQMERPELSRHRLPHGIAGYFSPDKSEVFLAKDDGADWPFPYHISFLHNFIGPDDENSNLVERLLEPFQDAFETRGLKYSLLWSHPNTSSVAPIRSKPERTYDPINENPSVEGGEMPLLFRNLKRKSPDDWNRLKKKLVQYGQDAGLFSDISIQTLGSKSSSNPFQLKVKARGARSNFIDVGYGVSQIMPILSRILQETSTSTFLLQQPEVHLHPRAQASFISFLSEILAETKADTPGQENLETSQFILETHSDYMIDRARIEIKNEKIKAEDVGLVYLEPKGNYVDVHNISFNEDGDFSHLPPSYREFFLSETKQLLGFKE